MPRQDIQNGIEVMNQNVSYTFTVAENFSYPVTITNTGTAAVVLSVTGSTTPAGGSGEFIWGIRVPATTVTFNPNQTGDFDTIKIEQVTINQTTAQTIANARSLRISGPPIAGTNTTITNDFALFIDSGVVSFGSGTLKTGGIWAKYNNVLTAGNGMAAVFSSDIESKTNLAPAGFSYSPPSTAGTYRITGFVEVTTGTTIALKLKVTYKTPSGATGSDEMVFTLQNSTTLLNSIITTGRYYFTALIGIDNSGTNIVLADNAGTYTTCVYNINAVLEQLA